MSGSYGQLDRVADVTPSGDPESECLRIGVT